MHRHCQDCFDRFILCSAWVTARGRHLDWYMSSWIGSDSSCSCPSCSQRVHEDPPDFVYLLENCPHDWLFPRCAAVVHHGGAGTTAAGLKAACPTTIVPFFGDQPFWGDRVHLRGVGPLPIPVEHFSLEKLVAAIQFMLDPQVKERAIELAKAMEGEDGVVGAVNAFHKHLPIHMPACRTPKPSRQRRLSQTLRRMWCSG
ncbi:hypothetical protein O6H91_04G082100 [Diphasiastrum complanatum]|uniref:Uncharacterized protein n=1 Tax=Diphasiastrum complanatum TaxID=34168 RepID=A0ACC2DZE1_DIPCM|nr:hypothetical protein O6H91_04G082100 [Diphasiastrum complanatum]